MKKAIFGGLVMNAIVTSVAAQDFDVSEIKSQANTEAQKFAELREVLRSENTDLRLATFDAMVSHGNPSLYEIAVSMGISDVDDVVRARALWEILSRTRTLAILVDPDSTVTDKSAQEWLQNNYQGRMAIQVGSAHKDVNCINLHYNKEDCVAGYNLSVNGTLVTFIFANEYLEGTMALDSDGVLRGIFRNSRSRVEFPVEVPLR